MNNKHLQIGDILTARKDYGFLPPKIQFFMKTWAKIHYDVSFPEYYNHMMIVTGHDYIAEAIGKGYVQRKLSKAYNGHTDNLLVFKPIKPLKVCEQKRIVKKAGRMSDQNIEYERLNFAWWVPYILSNGKIDWSPKESKKGDKVFCFEVAAMIFNHGRPGTFPQPDKVTTVDMRMNSGFRIYRVNRDWTLMEQREEVKEDSANLLMLKDM